jgi:hypothetical protein
LSFYFSTTAKHQNLGKYLVATIALEAAQKSTKDTDNLSMVDA